MLRPHVGVNPFEYKKYIGKKLKEILKKKRKFSKKSF